MIFPRVRMVTCAASHSHTRTWIHEWWQVHKHIHHSATPKELLGKQGQFEESGSDSLSPPCTPSPHLFLCVCLCAVVTGCGKKSWGSIGFERMCSKSWTLWKLGVTTWHFITWMPHTHTHTDCNIINSQVRAKFNNRLQKNFLVFVTNRWLIITQIHRWSGQDGNTVVKVSFRISN